MRAAQDKESPRIILIGPHKGDGKLRAGQFLAPPLGIYRIASYVEKMTNIIVDVYDPNISGVHELQKKIEKQHYDVIGFSLLHPTLRYDIPLIFDLHDCSPESIFIAGGQGASFNYSLLLTLTPIDIVVRGFGERPLIQIVRQYNPEKSIYQQFGNIPGLYIKNNEKNVVTPLEPPYSYSYFEDISLSFNFNKVKYENYWQYMQSVYSSADLSIRRIEEIGFKVIRLITSSHCPIGCKFCSSTHFLDAAIGKRQKIVQLSANEIIELMKKALVAYPTAEAFFFDDDNFIQSKNRIFHLCDFIEQEPSFKNLKFLCVSRVDKVDLKLLNKMAETNFKLIIYGIESFSNRILKDIRKNIRADDPARLAKLNVLNTLENGITPLMNLILFYPTASIEDIIVTIESALDLIQFGARVVVYPYVEAYPGSTILAEGFPVEHEEFFVEGFKFKIPSIIPPIDKQVSKLAKQALKLKLKLMFDLKHMFHWQTDLPQTIDSLALFLAVYRLLNITTEPMENLIYKMFSENMVS